MYRSVRSIFEKRCLHKLLLLSDAEFFLALTTLLGAYFLYVVPWRVRAAFMHASDGMTKGSRDGRGAERPHYADFGLCVFSHSYLKVADVATRTFAKKCFGRYCMMYRTRKIW